MSGKTQAEVFGFVSCEVFKSRTIYVIGYILFLTGFKKMAFYQPPEHISNLLEERVKISYKEVIEAGATYHISYSQDRGTTKASVNFYNKTWSSTALYELTLDKNTYRWYMVRDWND